MLSFAWRWAQVGDAVFVHTVEDPSAELLPGVVKFAQRHGRVTRLGIQVAETGLKRVQWPFRQDVHPDPLDPAEHCIRCDRSDLVRLQAEGQPR